MYSDAELFIMAEKQPKPLFLNNVTLSIADDGVDRVDLDAEAMRLGWIWDAAHMTMQEMVDASRLNQTAFARQAGIPLRTVQDWCGHRRSCPVYIRFLLAEHFGLIC